MQQGQTPVSAARNIDIAYQYEKREILVFAPDYLSAVLYFTSTFLPPMILIPFAGFDRRWPDRL